MNKNLKFKVQNSESGIVALLTTIIIMSIGVVITVSSIFIFLNRVEASRNIGYSEQAYFAAESGIEDALLRRLDLNKQASVSSYNFSVGSGLASITLDDVIGGQTTITSDGAVNNRIRRLEVIISVTTDEVSFFYGAQVGDGGLSMDKNSTVTGNIYSNGSVIGANGATITGDVFVAGDGASSNEIKKVDIGGDAHAPSLRDCDIAGDIFFITGGEVDDCIAGGSVIEQSEAIEFLDMPLSSELIDGWKQDAQDGGIISSGDYTPAEGSTTIGPGVIGGNLNLTNNQTLILVGTVYVVGNVDVDNGSSIQLSSSYGMTSGVIITDGWVHIKNNGVFSGSGEENSHLVFLSTSLCRGSDIGNCTHHNSAIDVHNNAEGAIFYAADGLINIHNNVELTQVNAWKLSLDNNATVSYVIGLSSAVFSSGPGGANIIRSWIEK